MSLLQHTVLPLEMSLLQFYSILCCLWTRLLYRSLSHRVPAAWNNVPGEIRQAKTAQAFQKAYKVHRRNMVAISWRGQWRWSKTTTWRGPMINDTPWEAQRSHEESTNKNKKCCLWTCLFFNSLSCLCTSVADPDPPDPHVFWPPGSGSGSTCHRGMDPDPSPYPSMIMQKW